MQENNSINNHRVSIQLLLGGLSFYCPDTREYALRRVVDGVSALPIIDDELRRMRLEVIDYWSAEINYAMIPLPLFDEQQSERYLAAKSYYPSKNQQIVWSIDGDIAYVSLVDTELYAHLQGHATRVNILPTIVKAVRYTLATKEPLLVLSHSGTAFDMVCGNSGKILFCDTFIMHNSDDVRFCIVKVQEQHRLKKLRTVVLRDESRVLEQVLNQTVVTMLTDEIINNI